MNRASTISLLLSDVFPAGVVAVPVYPPDPMRIQRTVTRLKTILDDSNANLILTGVDEYRRFASLFAPTEVLNTSEISVEESCEFREQIITAETLAFLQYTSGSNRLAQRGYVNPLPT